MEATTSKVAEALALQAQELKEWVRGVKKQITAHDIIVYTHSFVRAIAIELMTRYPTMGGLILESPFIATDSVFRCYEVHPRGQDAHNT